jgi:pyruvate/2-oxoglutarate dehydrogenase complex dihydrolipoamide dehydrogenase (E3) component
MDPPEPPPALSEHLAVLLERIASKTAVVGVMGMGYVGVPLASTFHRMGFQVRNNSLVP